MMTHTFEHPRDPEVTVNLCASYAIKVQRYQNHLYFDVPYFKVEGTKRVSVKIDFTYKGSEDKINRLMRTIKGLMPQVRQSNFYKIYKTNLSLDEETNFLKGCIEIHFFKPKSSDPRLSEDQVNDVTYDKYGYQEEDLEPLSAEKIISEVKLIREEFDALLQ
jgi:hypothetical protein